MRLTWLWMTAVSVLMATGALAGVTETQDSPAIVETPMRQIPTFSNVGVDTLRTNLWVAEALLGTVVAGLLEQLPPPPVIVLLVPASTEPAANLLTNVATNILQRAGYQVHLDKTPPDTEEPVIEWRYRVVDLVLSYPKTGRRLGLWKSWFSRQMDVSIQVTSVERASGQVLSSQHLSHSFLDRVPQEYMGAIASTAFPFTSAQPQASGWTRRLEEIVVLGALVGLVAIYFANTE